MLIRAVVAMLVFSAISVVGGVQTVQVSKGRPATVAERLSERHIGLDAQSLIHALWSSDSEVRSLAAAQLANEKDKNALSPILQALEVERVPTASVDLAFAATKLGSRSSLLALIKTCNSASELVDVRLRASAYVRDLGGHECMDTTEQLAVAAPDPNSRAQALSLLTGSGLLSQAEREKVSETIVRALSDSSPQVRLVASNTLTLIGDSTAVPYLAKAILAEEDLTVRSQMQSDMQELQKK